VRLAKAFEQFWLFKKDYQKCSIVSTVYLIINPIHSRMSSNIVKDQKAGYPQDLRDDEDCLICSIESPMFIKQCTTKNGHPEIKYHFLPLVLMSVEDYCQKGLTVLM